MDEPSTSFGQSNLSSVQSARTLSPVGASINTSGTESSSIEFRDDRSQEKGIPTHTKVTDETLTDDATDDTTPYSSLSGYQKYLFIQMELCQRETLRDWLSKNVRNRYRIKVFNYFEQILDAVIYMHDKDYIHRDLKPSNILFAMNDSIKVGDFGLVKQNAATKHSAPQTDVQGSHTSEIGTSFYVSPEQEAGHRYNERADVYSLGIILFELYFPFSTVMERAKVLGDVKSNRRLPKEFKENLHNEAKLVELMLKPISDRPSSSEIKEIDAFKQMKDQAELNCDFMLLKF
ncbi:PREDICTED: eukaryotic translation initiation factor 2-alpha kinase 3-like isoform X2 [Amphimedon queenslandica]|uniref:non-specific serine/threonine protein kinase n=1 Tax=Amphimedon queenslandica TaxID=400682 RepID=A0AAN0JMR5_AMPQE|nr:PREDICTED: eukaryotic translation initiation factor 2-alpha kinase 3-like isoform X2 [Amphimedon queenslandica]|eukprot:XP_019858293.1 PREDICTED: eukaryotic translation initiation factor 2-alpha kinase 3-like isoform X2 [Amphimedon queenslandica]